MKRIVLFVTMLVLCAVVVPAQEQGSSGEEQSSEVFNMLVPIFFYTSDTGFAGGGLFQRLYPTGLNLSLAGFYTQLNQVNIFYSTSYFTPGAPWWIKYGGSGRYFPEEFYGLGPDTELKDEEQYTSVGVNQYFSVYHRLIDGLYAGPMVRYKWVDIIDPDSGGLVAGNLVPGTEGYQLVNLGFGLGTGRDPAAVTPFLRYYYEATGGYAFTVSGDSAAGILVESDLRLYYDLEAFTPVLRNHMLAFQQVIRYTNDELPFCEMPSIGGGNQLRGYAADRFRDSTAAIIQGDYRFPVYKKFKGALFFGVGNVGETVGDLVQTELKPAWGGGLRFQPGPTADTSFRLDAAWTPEGYGVYFTFGEAF